jgi:hypothetical protein
MRRVNYLNNKDILKEIHKSKTTYCSFIDKDVHQYDIIIRDMADLPSVIIKAKENRADRLAKASYDAAVEEGKKVKLAEFEIDPTTIETTDLVVRLMKWDHIPQMTDEKKKVESTLADFLEEELTDIDDEIEAVIPKAPGKYVKVNFPPFEHYKLGADGQPYLVGRSHWKGDLVTGEFNKEHGAVTRKLADMYIKLVERYATRSNWRGYTYNDEMRSQALLQLSQIGLQFDESKSENPFSYYTAVITNSFTRVLNIEKRNQNLRDDILEMNNLTPSSTRQNSGRDHNHYDE